MVRNLCIHYIKYGFLLLFVILLKAGLTQMTIMVQVPRVGFDAKQDSLFLAGSFNSWHPHDTAYMLTQQNDSVYSIVLTPAAGNFFAFKCTKGSWEKSEVTVDGNATGDHTFFYKSGSVVYLKISAFSDITKKTIIPNAGVIEHDICAPQLNRQVHIRVYTPCDYNQTTDNYAVLYLFDGQNLFDNTLSAFGDWGVDESVDSICRAGGTKLIVVGIDHGNDARISEYSPGILRV